ncbi:MAG: hypothetical protein QNJ22_00810 [Desulfosarcinaceae bacterium]|nr:hypothetical protein [Desulfosarcinaceae bacterium]
MAPDAHPHLNSDQLLQAVVSENELTRDLRSHLNRCATCRLEVDRLARRFNAIGRMARELSPDALGRVRLPDRRRRFFLGRRVGLRPALGMAVAMVLLLMIALYQPLGHRSTPTMPAMPDTAGLTPEAEAQLFAEIQALLHNPLPNDYQNLFGAEERFGDVQDLTDFIVPDVEAEAEEELSTSMVKGTA